MNKKSFGLSIKMLTSNFGLTLDPELKEDKARVKLIFDILESKGFTDQDFKKAVIGIISSESSLFGNLPPIEMFLKHAGKKEINLDDEASLQVERIIKAASYPTTTLFDNGFTNAAVMAYGGLQKIHYDHFDKFNPKPKARQWLKKELVDIWLGCQVDNKRKDTPFIIDGNVSRIDFVGDVAKCQRMVDKSKRLALPVSERVDWTIKTIGNQKIYKKFDFEKAKRLAVEACVNSPYYNYED